MIGLFSPVQPGSEGCPPKMCADEVDDEDEGQVWEQWTLPAVFQGAAPDYEWLAKSRIQSKCLGPLGFERAQHRQTLRPSVDVF